MAPDIEKAVFEMVSTHLDVPLDQLQSQTHLAEDLGMDSVDAMDVFMAISEAFDVDIHPDKLTGVKTLGDLVTLVSEIQ